MIIKIDGDEWSAEVLCSDKPNRDGFRHVVCTVRGEMALVGTQTVLNILAGGREAFIRATPRADNYTLLDENKIVNQGYTRFSFSEKPGYWRVLDDVHETQLPFGSLQLQKG